MPKEQLSLGSNYVFDPLKDRDCIVQGAFKWAADRAFEETVTSEQADIWA